jgi:hypothetical protein
VRFTADTAPEKSRRWRYGSGPKVPETAQPQSVGWLVEEKSGSDLVRPFFLIASLHNLAIGLSPTK